MVKGRKSSWRSVTGCPPQESELASIQFNLFINDLDDRTERALSNLQMIQNREVWSTDQTAMPPSRGTSSGWRNDPTIHQELHEAQQSGLQCPAPVQE